MTPATARRKMIRGCACSNCDGFDRVPACCTAEPETETPVCRVPSHPQRDPHHRRAALLYRGGMRVPIKASASTSARNSRIKPSRPGADNSCERYASKSATSTVST